MPIKAKPVDPQRAIEVARGQLSTLNSSQVTISNKSDFSAFDKSRRQTVAFNDNDDNSSTTTSSEATTTPEVLFLGHRSSQRQEPHKQSPQFNDAEEFILESARKRTKALLYLKSESIAHNSGISQALPQHNERLLRYELAKAHKIASKSVLEASLVSEAPNVRSNSDASESPQCVAPIPDSTPSLYLTELKPSQSLSNSDEDETKSTGITHTVANLPYSNNADTTYLDPVQESFATLLDLLGKDIQTRPEPSARDLKQRSLLAKSENGSETRPKRSGPPLPRTFAELEQEALVQLYRNWCDPAQEEGSQSPIPFVASNHTAEALAMSKAVCQDRRGIVFPEEMHTAPSLLPDEPMTLEEMIISSQVRRTHALRPSSADPADEGTLLSIPAALSQQAQERLNRFWLSVMWVERLVSDMRFARSLAGFLYAHHKIFMRYIIHQTKGKTFKEIDDHDHEEYDVYEKFGHHVSTALLHVLTHNVPGFDEAEFVEELYEYPVNLNLFDGDENSSSALGSQGILSYQAWRIISAMSDFESFFLWMIDFINEEYEVELSSKALVAVGGARGLRALLQSTYHFERKADTETSSISSPLPLTVPSNVETVARPSSSSTENVLEVKSQVFLSKKQPEESASQVDQTSEMSFAFITDGTNSFRPKTMSASISSDVTTQNRKLLRPTPSGSAGSRRFFHPNKTLRARAVRNLPALHVPSPDNSSLDHQSSSRKKSELRDSYPGALKSSVSPQKSGNIRQSTAEVTSTSIASTRNTSAQKKVVRFASSTAPKLPTARTKSKGK
ncbi:unnamed protein product [Phytomonas sp. Hart1]|nr:unnamed protein product [Phytomonas sp. Hart1]|eukprot:CCW70533.1 unnamed protein product [Phytomonas sp. isolate Hart1]